MEQSAYKCERIVDITNLILTLIPEWSYLRICFMWSHLHFRVTLWTKNETMTTLIKYPHYKSYSLYPTKNETMAPLHVAHTSN